MIFYEKRVERNDIFSKGDLLAVFDSLSAEVRGRNVSGTA